MEKNKIEYFKLKLLSEQKQLLIALSPQKLEQLAVDSKGDEADEIQANTIIAIDTELSNRASAKLNAIRDALDKIDSNSFGLCEDCGDEIPEKRLEINPCFKVCIGCAEEREFEAKQRISK